MDWPERYRRALRTLQGLRRPSNLMTQNEARRIAAGIAKLPGLVRKA